MMHTQVRTVDPDADELIDVAAGEVGELVLAGPEIMLGYWNDPDATAATLIDGWLRTGRSRPDRTTRVSCTSSTGPRTCSSPGGLNVYPAEIEAVLSGIDGVAECAVIGVADERWGETPLALIGPSAGRGDRSRRGVGALRRDVWPTTNSLATSSWSTSRCRVACRARSSSANLRAAYADPTTFGTPVR